ncbi:NUDIX hydrolase [Ovoidimarina sediminis]|uniref:hypothetical protein n=1 Tax=Ovoidimarina sediminis TaxID=3079856 RepID=UPI002930DD81|nr:hypothetical protein [Rhodophyticola sp. MJ-SS7]
MIRPVAIGLPFRDSSVLAAAVAEDDVARKGWRPPGGGINLFDRQGARGHEIVFVFELALDDAGLATRDSFVPEDQQVRSRAAWIDFGLFREGRERLLPDGLWPLLDG